MNKLTVILPAILLSANVLAYCDIGDGECVREEAERDQQRYRQQEMYEEQNRQREREYEEERRMREANRQMYDDEKYRIGSDQNTNDVICHYLDTDC